MTEQDNQIGETEDLDKDQTMGSQTKWLEATNFILHKQDGEIKIKGEHQIEWRRQCAMDLAWSGILQESTRC